MKNKSKIIKVKRKSFLLSRNTLSKEGQKRENEAIAAEQKLQAIRDQVLNGNIDELPPINSKTVRIFISSTFTGNYCACFRPSKRTEL